MEALRPLRENAAGQVAEQIKVAFVAAALIGRKKMAYFSDYFVIQRASKKIGDGTGDFVKEFQTAGRRAAGYATFSLMVRDLTAAETKVPVRINRTVVGYIERYNGANRKHWHAQTFAFAAKYLRDGVNELRIQPVGWIKAERGNLFDDFFIKDVICAFKKSA